MASCSWRRPNRGRSHPPGGRVTRTNRLTIVYCDRCTLRASGRVAYQPMAVFCRTQLTPWPRVLTFLARAFSFSLAFTTPKGIPGWSVDPQSRSAQDHGLWSDARGLQVYDAATGRASDAQPSGAFAC